MKYYYIYILSNEAKTLYIGVTKNLARRIREHKNKSIKGFTSKYNLTKLIYYEITTNIKDAISREKQLKGWIRIKKIALIEENNRGWDNLSVLWKI